MARIFITGSTQGLGLAAARTLIAQGHDVVVHARTAQRAGDLGEIAGEAAGVVVGDLAVRAETIALADEVNELGRMDAVIHNAGVYTESRRVATPEGHARVLAVNVLAPYLLTAKLQRPSRLVFLTSGMHRSGTASLDDVDWLTRRWEAYQAYSDSKLLVSALAFALARRWPEVASNAVDPGWVPTRMGGPNAPDDLEQGHLTQAWLAAGEDDDARTSGGYWYHQRRREPAAPVRDEAFQDAVVAKLAELTRVDLPN
ncbi:SDR family NAD(P)-dependent oxidoreductase [Sinomonas humi]|uniref:Daunorubicin C-13 ketoreductase n=1 Tax=Sinomonas humi TaxID=1338436 RepID=A0A0B2AD05_9MICC|nr:SDR family NAD(P)-dependent oxidoreductase [Sinomonas humi]KHL01439.1 daunorubicin C-13 ketoreductase [Sinomonas humi]